MAAAALVVAALAGALPLRRRRRGATAPEPRTAGDASTMEER
jgi:hypothetical protein